VKDRWPDGEAEPGRIGDRRLLALEDKMVGQVVDDFAKEPSQESRLGARAAEAVCVLCRFDHVVFRVPSHY
jgi:hypothetical protein